MSNYSPLDIVQMTILILFPTEQVKANIKPKAMLRKDLGLSIAQIAQLATELEKEAKQRGIFDKIPYEYCDDWVTVQDIADTLILIINNKALNK